MNSLIQVIKSFINIDSDEEEKLGQCYCFQGHLVNFSHGCFIINSDEPLIVDSKQK